MASHGHPSKNAPSGPLLVHSLHPMQSRGSTSMRPNGGWQVSATQYIQSSTGQYSTQAGEPAHPVQHSLITAIMCGLRLRLVVVPVDFGSRLTTLSAANSAIVGSASATVRLPPLSVGPGFSPAPHTNIRFCTILADPASDVNPACESTVRNCACCYRSDSKRGLRLLNARSDFFQQPPSVNSRSGGCQ